MISCLERRDYSTAGQIVKPTSRVNATQNELFFTGKRRRKRSRDFPMSDTRKVMTEMSVLRKK